MPIDLAGITPGLQKTEEAPKKVDIRCKSYPDCNSIQAIEVNYAGNKGSRLYQCCKCHRTWSVAVGGSVDL